MNTEDFEVIDGSWSPGSKWKSGIEFALPVGVSITDVDVVVVNGAWVPVEVPDFLITDIAFGLVDADTNRWGISWWGADNAPVPIEQTTLVRHYFELSGSPQPRGHRTVRVLRKPA